MVTAALTNGGTAIGGRNGKAVIDNDVLVRVKQWTVNAVTSVSEWGDSGSLGYTFRKAARLDATGTIVGNLDATDIRTGISGANDFVGKSIQLSLFEIHATQGWSFPCAIITGYDITCDMDTKEVIEWTINWAADGAWYRPGRAAISGAQAPGLQAGS